MTDKEIDLLSKIADLHNEYRDMPDALQNDLPEWVNAIHQLQRIICTQSSRREHPELFYLGKKP